MDISQLKNLVSYRPSLTEFLGGGKADYFQNLGAKLIAASTAATNTALSENAAAGAMVSLSEEAQKLLAQNNGSDDGNISGVQKAGQNFLMGFFDQSGLDLENLSEDALKLIRGLQDVVGTSAATTRDFATDGAEEKYANGAKKAYTLIGGGTRLRLAIEYGTDGKPQKLSVTDITGGQVETAEITLQKGDKADGTMTITRTQREYVNGHMNMLNEIEPLEVDLYTAS